MRHEQPSDLAALVDRAIGGDVEAFHALYESYHRRVVTYADVRLRGREEAEDVAQDVFLAVWRQLPAFEDRHPDAFPAWLFRIAHNVVTDRVRRAARRRSVPLEMIPGEPRSKEEGVLSHMLSDEAVADMLGGLPERQREVLILRFILDLPQRQVARILELGEGAVESLQVRALRSLRKEMPHAT